MSRSNFDKPLTLDKAIEQAEKVAGECATSCQRDYKQVADWLRELKESRKHGNAADMHSALTDAYMVLTKAHMDNCPIPTGELVRVLSRIELVLAGEIK